MKIQCEGVHSTVFVVAVVRKSIEKEQSSVDVLRLVYSSRNLVGTAASRRVPQGKARGADEMMISIDCLEQHRLRYVISSCYCSSAESWTPPQKPQKETGDSAAAADTSTMNLTPQAPLLRESHTPREDSVAHYPLRRVGCCCYSRCDDTSDRITSAAAATASHRLLLLKG